MDLENSQMLQCIIYKFEQTFEIDLTQRSIIYKGLIKYIKTNGITPMKTHVEITHPKLWVHKKQLCSEKVVTFYHTQ
jgi:hypothetical protein